MFTKISYAVYLVQFPVFFYNVGMTRHVDQFKPRMLVALPCSFLWISVLSNVISFSVTVTGNVGNFVHSNSFDAVCGNAFSKFEKDDFQ